MNAAGPTGSTATDGGEGVEGVARLLGGRRCTVLAGAGCSTGSGIPDYRGRGRRPDSIRHADFVRDPATRRRYWARSFRGWPRIAGARPNAAHRALATLEAAGVATGVLTQNVDGLHAAAGSRNVLELHGNLARVRCLGCDAQLPRTEMQARLRALNPAPRDGGFAGGARARRSGDAAVPAPDGDADVDDPDRFRVPPCPRCGGVLMPDVVFFGGSLPAARRDRAFAMLRASGALLVVGSSLAVYSGFRFVKDAHHRGLPVAILNRDPTRGDPLAGARCAEDLAVSLPALVERLI